MNAISPISFSGLYEPHRMIKRQTMLANYLPLNVNIYRYTYHPFEDETDEQIAQEIKSYKGGRRWSIFEKDHGHYIGQCIEVQNIEIGQRIKEEDKEKYLKYDFYYTPNKLVSDKEFELMYDDNDCYLAFDIKKLGAEDVDSVIDMYM